MFAETKEEDVYNILERRLWDDPNSVSYMLRIDTGFKS